MATAATIRTFLMVLTFFGLVVLVPPARPV
ncbi:hypothetical protein L600_003100000270 [Isoptericola variabilis J7]|nr:hypothetical protein L600_003100000270 [Isoptericola variabilis J7]